MLNEFKEYNDYTKDLNLNVNSDNPDFKSGEIYGRLLLESITNRSGIVRVLTIIARRFIFHDIDNMDKQIELSEVNLISHLKLAEKNLLAWCSNQTIDSNVPSELIGKFGNGRYYDYMLDAHKAFTNLVKRITANEIISKESHLKIYISTTHKIEKAIEYWNKTYMPGLIKNKFYSVDGMKNKYGNKIVTLDLIIASALQEGPLKNQSVLVPISIFPRLVETFQAPHSIYITDFLFTSALYVISKLDNENDYQVINSANMSNWLGKKNFPRSFKDFNDILSEKELFSQEIVFNVTKKISVSEYLIDGFKVVQGDTPITDDFLILTDNIPLENIQNQISEAYRRVYTQK